jgi:uncharacterized protein (TIGR02145 family)
MKRLSSFVAIIFIVFAFFSCKKGKELSLPDIKTTMVRAVGSSSLQVTGEVVSDGNSYIIMHGICWSEKPTPSIADDTIVSGEGAGSFVGYVKKLKSNTKYYLRAYATNHVGTSYGEVMEATTTERVADADGNIYNTVRIGNQLWMSENLKSTHYRNGDPLQIITSDLGQTTGAYSNNVHLGMGWEFYGNYYNWYAVNDSRNICPQGWHIPTKEEWDALIETYAGENENLKFIVENYAYDDMVKGATNESGLSALPMGSCIRVQTSTAPSYAMGVTMGDVSIWSATETSDDSGSAFYIAYPQGQLSPAVVKLNKRTGCAVRCIKD